MGETFVVAAWERKRRRERELHSVEAETAEHAVVKVVESRPVGSEGAVYEAWPASNPGANVRMSLEPRRAAAPLS